MTQHTAEAVICGAGIAGAAVSYELARRGIREIVLVERGDPLALTSDKSTECYRNWWPGPGDAMVALMSRSIDMIEALAEETDNRIRLNRRGYLYATARPEGVADLRRAAEEITGLGAGQLREHRPGQSSYLPPPAHGWRGQPDGADLITDQRLIREHFPYLGADTLAVLHARRCGWLSAQQLGSLLLERARAAGARVLRGSVERVALAGGRVAGVTVATPGGSVELSTPIFVNAAGPLAGQVAGLLGVELPIINQLHLKASIDDGMGAVARDAPMIIAADPAGLGWDEEERAALLENPETAWMAGVLGTSAHCRPEGEGGSRQLLMLWEYNEAEAEPRFPPPLDPEFPEIVIRGLSAILPGLRGYFGRIPRAYLDGGYYTRTRENRPLIGPMQVEGAYMVCALSGFGVMGACAAGELVAAHICGEALPAYAAAFRLERYTDPAYQALLEQWGDVGQL
ncbi:FAD-binding oxidoreductase [Oscillochloris sp. ZM17-4]|uniref:NAD(P)/FAD-dependent oxidoreductase n=1 Tax=Oscillochloris sp. ZM17-4 TaxID=2866714 RepID=UPI001C72C75A|nr:FAD-dependent oxidoreductase [Oscillochloris sp. ZM17-4]MBX0326408.1 FAD-binding oxidoreductase [Oscillochloris sp. ZM17-4]